MIPILYKEDAQSFLDNGLGQMADTISAEVREVRNGEFELTLIYPVSGRLYPELADFRFIKAKPNGVDADHVFRITDRDVDTIANTVTIIADTITNDLGGNIVPKLTINNATGQEAMNLMKAALIDTTRYDFRSDITTRSSTTWLMRNPLNCIAGQDGSLLDNWGGEIKRETDRIWLLKNRGVDNNVVIRHGKNLEGLTVTYSTKGMVTRILPYFTYTPEGATDELTITGSIVTSQYINNYPVRPIVPVDYSSEEGVKDLTSLNTIAALYFTDRAGIDKPSMTADVSLIDLALSSEYSDFKALEKVELCDTIVVYSKLHDVHLTARVNELVYDVLGERNISLTIGSVQTSFFEAIKNDYQALFEKKQEQLNNIIQTAANGKNRIFRGKDMPTTGMIKNDLWYTPVVDPVTRESGTYMYIYDGTDWKLDKVSANMLNGTIDAENGDLNLINVNVQTLVGETSSFVRSNWNSINSQIDINGQEMTIANPTTGVNVVFKNGDISFRQGTQGRHLQYQTEGLKLLPYSENVGTNKNTALHLIGGGSGSYQYIQFVSRETDGIDMRLEASGQIMTAYHGEDGSFNVAKYGEGPNSGLVLSGAFETRHSTGVSLRIAGDSISTPRDGARNIFIVPQGVGSVVSGNAAGTRYNVVASDFVKQSTRESKTEINEITSKGMDVINRLTPVSYKKKDKLARGIDEVEIGFIAEDSLEVATEDGEGIYDSHILTYSVKNLQELNAENQLLKQELQQIKEHLGLE